jgi:hypothetical protein
MSDIRKQMESSIQDTVVPALRSMGFRGSFPHFYRDRKNHIDLLSFQYRLAGGSFVVELSFATPTRENVYIDKTVPANKLRVSQTTKRKRLGAEKEGSDNWFSFEPSGIFRKQPDLNRISEEVVALLKSDAELWWERQRIANMSLHTDPQAGQ